MRAGQLRHRVRLLAETRTQDDAGEEVLSFATSATVWAEKTTLTGRERYVAERTTAEVDMAFRLRHRKDTQTTMRIIDEDGIFYDVRATFDPTGRRRETMILAQSARPPLRPEGQGDDG